MGLDTQPTLKGERLILSPLAEIDRDGLFAAASDPKIWEQHPANTRYQRDVFDPYFDFLLNTRATLVAKEIDSGETIGCSQYYPVPDQIGDYGIGYTFLRRANWGGGWNRDMKRQMIAHVLKTRKVVWFHIDPNNQRSHIATTRLGAKFQYRADLDLGSGIADFNCYSLNAKDWSEATGESLDRGGSKELG